MKHQTAVNEEYTTYRHCEERSNPEKRELDCFVPRNDDELDCFVPRNDEIDNM